MAHESRFRKPEFKEKLARARTYERRIGSARWPRYFVLALCLTAIYFLAVSKFFLAMEASVNENGPSAEQVQKALSSLQGQRLWHLIPKNHILILDKAVLLSELQKTLLEVRSVKVLKKSWPNKLNLLIEMREPHYVWQTGTEFYLLDQDGEVFEQILGYTPVAFSQILIADAFGAPVKLGEALPIASALKFIEDIREKWPLQVNETSIVSFSVPALRSKDIIVKTGIGFSILFDLERPAAEQLADLKIVLREQILPETYIGLSYIDLRLPTTAYYCYKDAPCAPEYTTSTPAIIP